jgi:hypothetical protein
MRLQGRDSRVTNETFSGRFGAVSRMASKRNQLRKRPKSFGRTRAEAQSGAQSGPRVRGYSCSVVRSKSPMTETLGIVSSNSTTIHASPDMQATLRPSSWYHATIGGHRCPATSASMSSTVICATGLKYNVDDPSASSTPRRLLKHHGT